jgi:hypothetical protein
VFSKLITVAWLIWSSIFKPVVGSVNGTLIPGEIKKAILAALGASSIVGGLIAGLNSVQTDLPQFLTSPATAAVVSAVIVQLVGLLGQIPQSHTGERLLHFIDHSPYLRYGHYEETATPTSPSISVTAEIVLEAVAQNIVGRGEARSILFPNLVTRDGEEPSA